MIGTFSRQAIRARSGNRGQAAALFLVVAATLLAVVFASIRIHQVAASNVTTTNAVDAIALSAATWEARTLNLIAALNDGATQCFRIIRVICAIWAGLAVTAAYGAGIPAFEEYSRYARRAVSDYWNTAHALVDWSEKIRKAAPYLVVGEVASLSRERNVTGILYPIDPRGPHDGKNTLELHVAPGPPITLIEAIAPITGALDKLRRVPILKSAAKAVISLLDTVLRGIIGTSRGPIRMLEPESDLPTRQFVRFEGFRPVSGLAIPFLGEGENPRIFAEATALPYGGGAAEMRWKSRLTERRSE